MPHRSSVPMSWRLAKHRYELIGTVCKACGAKHFPPRSVCMECGKETERFQFSGNGTILSYTIIHTAPDGFERQEQYELWYRLIS